jgi:hypothetical protein
MPSSRSYRRCGRRAALVACLLLGVVPVLHGPALEARAQKPQRQQLVQPSATLVQRLRRLLNLSPPLAVGGSRSGSGQRVCLLSPWPTTAAQNQTLALALVPTATPVLLSGGPLNEIQILRRDRIAWQQRASSTAAISGAIPWPLEPLQPDEQVLVRLRPRGAAGADFAEIQLQAASAAQLQRHRQLLTALQAAPSHWPAAIEAELSRNPALAVALASDPSAPPAIQLAWRESAAASGCR